MKNTAILSVIYYEPEWHQTCRCLAQLQESCPTFFIDRGGIGSLAEAFNRGYTKNRLHRFDFVWMLTNVRFAPHTLSHLIRCLEKDEKLAAVTPTFQSDHAFTRPRDLQGQDPYETVDSVPFAEFTALLVRTKIFNICALDEEMPYAGHDIDWGYRVRSMGYRVGVYQGAYLEHSYIHQSVKAPKPHPITQQRWKLRQAMEARTKEILHKKHGPNWKTLLQCNY